MNIMKKRKDELLKYLENSFFSLNYIWLGLVVILYYTSIIKLKNYEESFFLVACSIFIFFLWLKKSIQIYDKIYKFKIFYEEDDRNEEKIEEFCNFKLNKNQKKGNLLDIVKNYHINHFYSTIALMGLFIGQYYFPDFEFIHNFFSLPIISLPYIFLVYFLGEYYAYVKNPTIRVILFTFSFINIPIYFLSLILGITSFFLLPMISFAYNTMIGVGITNYILTWIGEGMNAMFLLTIHFIILDSLKNKTIIQIKEKKPKIVEVDFT